MLSVNGMETVKAVWQDTAVIKGMANIHGKNRD